MRQKSKRERINRGMGNKQEEMRKAEKQDIKETENNERRKKD